MNPDTGDQPLFLHDPLVEALGRFYPVAHREGVVGVDRLTMVRAPLKAYKVESLAAIPAYKHFLLDELKSGRLAPDHIAVLHGPVYEPNPRQFMIARCFGVVFEADDAAADDGRVLRLLRYTPVIHSSAFTTLCIDEGTTEDGRTVHFCDLPNFKGLEPLPPTSSVHSTLSTAIAALKATQPYPDHVYPKLPTQAETLEWLAQTRGDEDEVGRAAFLRRTLDLVAEMRHTQFGGVDLSHEELDLPQTIFPPEDNDEADDEIVGVFQRLGYSTLRFTPPMGCRFSIHFPGHAHTRHHQLIDWEDDVLTNGYNESANCFNYFYPRTFRRVRQMGVLRCVPRLLGWLRSTRIRLADPSRPGVLEMVNMAVDDAMEAPVFTCGALGKRERGT